MTAAAQNDHAGRGAAERVHEPGAEVDEGPTADAVGAEARAVRPHGRGPSG